MEWIDKTWVAPDGKTVNFKEAVVAEGSVNEFVDQRLVVSRWARKYKVSLVRTTFVDAPSEDEITEEMFFHLGDFPLDTPNIFQVAIKSAAEVGIVFGINPAANMPEVMSPAEVPRGGYRED